MERLTFKNLLWVIITLIVVVCSPSEGNTSASEQANTNQKASTQNTDDSDKEWKLVWKDEFEGDILNPDNWNLRLKKPGDSTRSGNDIPMAVRMPM